MRGRKDTAGGGNGPRADLRLEGPRVAYYAGRSICDSTASAYLSAIRRYRHRRQELGDLAGNITAGGAAEWLTYEAEQGRVKAKTIETYRFALKCEFTLNNPDLPDYDNPMDYPIVKRVVDGALRTEKEGKLRGKSQVPAQAVTVEHLRQMQPLHDDSLEHVMQWAAMTLGICGFMRPGEVFGSQKVSNRRLRRSQITFYSQQKIVLYPRIGGPVPPYFYTVQLRASKTDHQKKSGPRRIVVATPLAVTALWNWMRRHPGPIVPEHKDYLFVHAKMPNGQCEPLLEAEALKHLGQMGERIGIRADLIKGRSYRRGGASSAAAAGAPLSDIADAGGWSSNALHLYIAQNAKLDRQIHASINLGNSS